MDDESSGRADAHILHNPAVKWLIRALVIVIAIRAIAYRHTLVYQVVALLQRNTLTKRC